MRVETARQTCGESLVDVSVIIPCRNVEATLRDQLDAVERQEWDGAWEVLVVDNASTDATARIVRDRMDVNPRIRLVTADERSGLSYARNSGVESSTAGKVLFCDGDDVVHPGWLAALAEGLDAHPLVTGALDVDSLNSPVLAASRGPGDAAPTFFGLFAEVAGCNMGVRREAFDAIGGFQDGYPTEDKKFALDAARLGLDVGFISEAVVAYRYRTEAADLWRQGLNYGRGRVQIVDEMLRAGLQRPSRVAGWRSWVWLLRHLPDAASSEGRARWVWVAANRLGQVRGSIQLRTLML